MDRVLVYGANGYTGGLIARAAVHRGLAPVLSGRNRDVVRRLANELRCEARPADLQNASELAGALEGMAAVLHCAGPFSVTSRPMLDACLAQRVHYLDITGEIDVFEAAHNRDEEARRAGIVLCPGVGFDVVPTDCLAAALRDALPAATYLALGFDSRSPLSRGTLRTTVEGLARGGRIRSAGRLVTVAHAFRVRDIDFGDGMKAAATIPWGDVSTAYYTTGIPNIEVYVPMPPAQIKGLRRLNHVLPLLRLRPVQSFLKSRVAARPPGPGDEARAETATWVWGEAQAANGDVRTARVRVGNLYDVTIEAALGVLARVLAGGHAGYRTPSQIVDPAFVETLPGAGRIELSAGRASGHQPR